MYNAKENAHDAHYYFFCLYLPSEFLTHAYSLHHSFIVLEIFKIYEYQPVNANLITRKWTNDASIHVNAIPKIKMRYPYNFYMRILPQRSESKAKKIKIGGKIVYQGC